LCPRGASFDRSNTTQSADPHAFVSLRTDRQYSRAVPRGHKCPPYELARAIQADVLEKFGVVLEPEPVFV